MFPFETHDGSFVPAAAGPRTDGDAHLDRWTDGQGELVVREVVMSREGRDRGEQCSNQEKFGESRNCTDVTLNHAPLLRSAGIFF